MKEWDGVNRRRFLRTKYPFTLHVRTCDGTTISTYTENISVGGISFTSRKQFNESTPLYMKIFLGETAIDVKGNVVRAQCRESDYLEGEYFYDIGVAFTAINEHDKKFLQQKIDGIKTDNSTSSSSIDQ